MTSLAFSIFFSLFFHLYLWNNKGKCNKIFKLLTQINTVTQKKLLRLLRMSISSQVSLWGNLNCWTNGGWDPGVQWCVGFLDKAVKKVEKVLFLVPVIVFLHVLDENGWPLWNLKIHWVKKKSFTLANSFILRLFIKHLWRGKPCTNCWGWNSEQPDKNPCLLGAYLPTWD